MASAYMAQKNRADSLEAEKEALLAQIKGLKTVETKFNNLEKRLKVVSTERDEAQNKLKTVETKFNAIENKLKDFENLENSFNEAQSKLKTFENLQSNFEKLEADFENKVNEVLDFEKKLNEQQQTFKTIEEEKASFQERLNEIEAAEKAKTWLVKIFTSTELVFCAMFFIVVYVALEITAPAMRAMGVSYWGSIVGAIAFDGSVMISILYGRYKASFVFVAMTGILLAVKFGVTKFLKLWDWTKTEAFVFMGENMERTVTIFSWELFLKGIALTVIGTMAVHIFSSLFAKQIKLKIE